MSKGKSGICLGIALAWFVVACEPPAKPTNPTSGTSSGPKIVVSAPSATGSAIAPSPMTSVLAQPLPSASSENPNPTPCPPEAPAPAGALAWVSGCQILIAQKIVFAIDKSIIRPESFPIIEAIGDILQNNPDFMLEIRGHLGAPEPYVRARNLARDRAESVEKYLISKKGIDPRRLEAKGYGADVPIADSKTEEGRAKNRRIEFVIWKWRGGMSRVMWPGP